MKCGAECLLATSQPHDVEAESTEIAAGFAAVGTGPDRLSGSSILPPPSLISGHPFVVLHMQSDRVTWGRKCLCVGGDDGARLRIRVRVDPMTRQSTSRFVRRSRQRANTQSDIERMMHDNTLGRTAFGGADGVDSSSRLLGWRLRPSDGSGRSFLPSFAVRARP
uniref:Uncharacterized protein n=1 Tax=Plectus sambesii TaxID=2011161 RepID=A0A914WYY6_9BILA